MTRADVKKEGDMRKIQMATTLAAAGLLSLAAAAAAHQAPAGTAEAEAKAEAKVKVETKVDKKALLDPSGAAMTQEAPAEFKVKFETTKGDFVVHVKRELSPLGADRFYNLVRHGFYNDVRFFRVMKGFMAQFGINGDPEIAKAYLDAGIKDEPVKASNTRGMVTFAKRGTPNSRTSQLFINFGNNTSLDRQGFSPFGEVTEGMQVVDSIYAEYGEGAPRGKGPNQGLIQSKGNAYLKASFPKLDYIKQAYVLPAD